MGHRFHKKRMKKLIENMTPMDDVMFACMFKDNLYGVGELLKICIGDESLTAKEVHVHDISPKPGFHSVVFDAKVVDGKGRIFDVEVQKDNRGASAKRARYYSSALDAFVLREGEPFENLNDSYVIFITYRDYWKLGEERIEFEMYSIKHKIAMHDGRHIIYVNGRATGESKIAKLMHDFKCTEAKDMNYNFMRQRADMLKSTKEGNKAMVTKFDKLFAKYLEEYRAENRNLGIEEGRAEGKAESRKEIAKKMKQKSMPIADIHDITGLSYKEIAAL